MYLFVQIFKLTPNKVFIFVLFVKTVQINNEEKMLFVRGVCLCLWGFSLQGWFGRDLTSVTTLVLTPWATDQSYFP